MAMTLNQGRVEIVRPFGDRKYKIGDVVDASNWKLRLYNQLIEQRKVTPTTKKVTVEEGPSAEAF